MKVSDKIKRYQAGGYMVYQPLPLAPPVAANDFDISGQSTGSLSEEEQVIDDKTIQKLLGNGITNDVMEFAREVNNAYQEYSMMSDIQKQTVYGKQLRSLMKGDFARINAIMRSKDLLTDSETNVKSQQASGDYAVTPTGVVIKDVESGQIAEISHKEYAEQYRNSGRYKLLTNSELLNEREYNPNLTGSSEPFNILRNAVGTEKVKEEVMKILTSIGDETTQTTRSAYFLHSSNNPEALQKAAAQLIGMAQEGYYKIEEMAESTSNERNLVAAREAMWNNLSSSSKSLLKAKAIAEGADSSEIEEIAKQYAVSLLNINYKSSTKTSTDATYDKQASEAAGKTGTSSDNLTDELLPWEQITTEVGDMQQVKVDLGSGRVTDAIGFSNGGFFSEGKAVGQTSIRNIPELLKVIDPNSVSIGGNKVANNKLDAIVYQGGEVTTIKFPSKTNRTGAIVPDFDRAEAYTNLVNKLSTLPSAIAREEAIKQAGFTSDGQGAINPGEYSQFLVFDGLVNDSAIGSTSDKRALREVEDNERELYESLYMTNTNDSSGDELAGTESLGMWFWADEVYRGRVFMAIPNVKPITGRNLDGKGLNVSKNLNTPYNLGTIREQMAKNKTQSGIRYTLDEYGKQ